MFDIGRIRYMQELRRVTEPTLRVLEVLVSGGDSSTWGLEIARLTNLKSGTVYPILERLEELGWVNSEWESNSERTGPRRRLYRLANEALLAANALLAQRVQASSLRSQSSRISKLV